MANRCGSVARSLFSAARASSRCRPPMAPARPPPVSAPPRLQRSRISFTSPRNLSELGGVQSFLPLYSMPCLTSHITVGVRAFCELSNGTFRRTCQDR